MDREKVIKGLELCKQNFDCPSECPYLMDCNDLMKPMFVDLAQDAFGLLKEYEKLSKTLFKIDKYFRIKDLEYLVDGIENGSIVVLQDDEHFIGCTPIRETTIKIRRL